MLHILRELIAHKGWANEAMLRAIRETPAAAADPELLALLHHILVANRFWYSACVGDAFRPEDASGPRQVVDGLIAAFALLQSQEEAWLAKATEDDMTRIFEDPRIPGGQCTIAHSLVQVCLHSQGHRAQVAMLLRRLGGTPPMTDFILWAAANESAGKRS